ncbi:glycosyl hydrolase [Halobellus marinus]|uniref:glycosyl hydrolase n=1 Tax=Halobellus TaxID=1073986 RepID=UPI0028AFDE6F|nr:glycosyl hydrolase [Halobellus sp. DFY28]
MPGSDVVARLFDVPAVGRLLGRLTGFVTTTNLWPIGDDRLLATVGDELFCSTDRGQSWRLVHRLPGSSGPMGVLPTAVCQHENRIYLAEYPLGDETAKVIVSDDGRKWSTYVSRSDVRHFHGVFHDPYTDTLWGTTGDTNEESTIGRFVDGEYHPVGRGSQTWRAVDLAFTPESVLWGMDCSYAPRIEILRLSRDDIPSGSADPRASQPTPEVVGAVDGPVFYAETIHSGGTTWVVFSTAATTGTDSTGPETSEIGSDSVRVVAASERTGYERWHQLAAVERSTTLGAVIPAIPTANAYAFLSSSPDERLLINPYNTKRNHGEVLVREPSSFEEAPQLSTVISGSGSQFVK